MSFHRFFQLFTVFFAAILLAGCAETQFLSHYAKKLPLPGQQQSAGTYKVGNAYKVGSVWYYPQEDFRMTETGIASWYGPDFHGKKTANGEVYDQNELTAAHRTLQMPSFVRVTNLENGRSIVVRINDRGPFKHGRVIDLSKRGADLLGFRNKGTARVRLEVMEGESRKVAAAARSGKDTSRLTLADLDKLDRISPAPGIVQASYQPPVVASAPKPVQFAALQMDPDALPESLQTPTITVEELIAPPSSNPGYELSAPQNEAPIPQYPSPERRKIAISNDMQSHVDLDGRVMPDPVVKEQPVMPTGIFIQAGSFAVYENAERLKTKLSDIAPVKIDPVTVKGRQLYRVKLGPVSSVDEADVILDKVIRAGNETARVIRN